MKFSQPGITSTREIYGEIETGFTLPLVTKLQQMWGFAIGATLVIVSRWEHAVTLPV